MVESIFIKDLLLHIAKDNKMQYEENEFERDGYLHFSIRMWSERLEIKDRYIITRPENKELEIARTRIRVLNWITTAGIKRLQDATTQLQYKNLL